MKQPKSNSTSWQPVASWYDKLVGQKGQYFHESIIIPNVLRLLSMNNSSTLLEVGCGQGVFARSIPKDIKYTGIDVSPSLIQSAIQRDKNLNHSYIVADATKSFPYSSTQYSHASIILALQNIEDGCSVIAHVSSALIKSGKFIIVLNHPCFRIPRQSSWGIDEVSKLEYRRMNRYMSPLKIPITTHPGQHHSPITWSFHYPLSTYTKWLKNAGFLIETIEEWVSDKTSVGKAGKMENRARNEFPIFMAISAKKI